MLALGYTQRLWEQGIWFSENDALHVLVAVWVIYVGTVLVERVRDRPTFVVLSGVNDAG